MADVARVTEAAGAARGATTVVERLAAWYGIAVVPLVAVLGLFTTTSPFVGVWPRFVAVAGPVAVAGLVLPALAPALRERRPDVTALVATFGALVAWSLVRLPGQVRTVTIPGTTTIDTPVPDVYVLVPLVGAALALLCGWLMAVATPPRLARPVLAALAVTVAFVSLVGLGRALTDANPVTRLYTALGGAATTHLALLLALAVVLGLAWEGAKPLAVGPMAAVVVGLDLLTGSRAAVVCLVLLVVVLGARYLKSGRTIPARVLVSAAGLGAALVLVAAVVMRDQLLRLLALGDDNRVLTIGTALAAWSSSPARIVAGTGTGTLWPWYASESGYVPVVGLGLVQTPYGTLLSNPHNTFLGPLAELGLVGLALLLVVVAVVVRAAARASSLNPLRLSLLTAAAVGCVAFATDYYLLKSFPLALLWWYVVVLALRLPPPAGRPARPGPR